MFKFTAVTVLSGVPMDIGGDTRVADTVASGGAHQSRPLPTPRGSVEMTKRVTAPRVGRTPDLLRKGGAMRDRTKYTRKGRMKRKWHE